MPQILAPPKERNPVYHLRRSNGSAIIGMSSNSTTLPAELQDVNYVVRGEKSYELSNHLGNVLSVISDRREAGSCTDSLVDFYFADGKSVADYYPFGMAMDSRTQSAGGYRWGFNGQEKDDEIAGSGNSYTAEFWQYDSRLGRRWNVDPVVKHHESPYAVFANNPVWFIDANGADTSFADKQAKIDFDNAHNNVKNRISGLESTISGYDEQLASGNLSRRDERKVERGKRAAQNELDKWNKLKNDFDNIISNPDVMFRYSSNTSSLRNDENGKIGGGIYRDQYGRIVSGTVNIIIRPGHDEAVIHENRHGNQILEDRYDAMSVLSRELEAYTYQEVYNYKSVKRLIDNAIEHKYDNMPSNLRPTSITLEEMIRFRYPDIIKQ